MTALTTSQLDALAEAAVAAPSADNHHVFRLQRREGGLRLLATEEFLQARGSRRILGLLSLGAVVENLRIRAAGLGLHLEPAWWLAGEQGGRPIADLAARAVPPAADPLEAAIAGRHTNRRLRFRGPGLAATPRRSFDAESAAVPGTGLAWLDAPSPRRQALGLIRRAESERFRNEALHRELFESIRFDVGWNATAVRGLPAGALALPVVERPAFMALRHWRVQRAANALGAAAFVGWRAAELPCRLAPHLCAVTASGAQEAAAVSAGQLLQRLWLRATLAGLAFQVFAASPLYALDGSTAIDARLREQLATGWARLCDGGRPFVVVRMGRAPPPSLRAGRPEARSFVLPD